MKTNNAKKVIAEPKTRFVRFFKHGNPKDKKKITGVGQRMMLDVVVLSEYENGSKLSEIFTVHVFKGEVRIIVPKTSYRDERLSMTVEDFIKYAERRWGKLKSKVIKIVNTINDPLPEKKNVVRKSKKDVKRKKKINRIYDSKGRRKNVNKGTSRKNRKVKKKERRNRKTNRCHHT